MRVLYPSDPFNKKVPDESYQEEYDAAVAIGLNCSLFSSEDFELGTFQPFPTFEEKEDILYRGWMLGVQRYAQLCKSIISKGGKPLTSPQDYQQCHHLPGWYELCKNFTPETIFLQKDSNFVESLAGLNWPGYFVKDYVKSLTTTRGSVAKAPEEVAEVVSLIESYRGKIEGGVCIRRFEELLPESEERYFVFHNRAYARDGKIPELVQHIAKLVSCPFFSVDVVLSKDGTLRLIELGDGQVSDRKQWPADRFVKMLRVGS